MLFILDKSKQLDSQNCSERSKRPQGSIKKYCTEKVSII